MSAARAAETRAAALATGHTADVAAYRAAVADALRDTADPTRVAGQLAAAATDDDTAAAAPARRTAVNRALVDAVADAGVAPVDAALAGPPPT